MRALRVVSLFALCFSLLLSCSPSDSDYPLDTPGHGLAALTWGMHPDSARRHMEEMQDVVLQRDTTFVIPTSRYPAFAKPDSVEYSDPPAPERSLRHMNFGGGSFMDNEVNSWGLVFEDTAGLIEINVGLQPDQTNQRRLMMLERAFESRYRLTDRGPWAAMGDRRTYESAGIAGSEDTTQQADTYVVLVDVGVGKEARINYRDLSILRRDITALDGRRRITVSRKEWEEMVKREGFE